MTSYTDHNLPESEDKHATKLFGIDEMMKDTELGLADEIKLITESSHPSFCEDLVTDRSIFPNKAVINVIYHSMSVSQHPQ